MARDRRDAEGERLPLAVPRLLAGSRGSAQRGIRIEQHPEYMDRLGNVLDLDLAQVLEGDVVPAPDLTEDGAGDADAAGIR